MRRAGITLQHAAFGDQPAHEPRGRYVEAVDRRPLRHNPHRLDPSVRRARSWWRTSSALRCLIGLVPVPSNVVDLAERTHSSRGDLAERTHCGTTVRALRVTPRLSRVTSRQPLPKPQPSGSRSVHCGIARVKTNPSFFRLITVLGSGRWRCAHANGRIRTDFAGGTIGSEHRFYRLGIEQRL